MIKIKLLLNTLAKAVKGRNTEFFINGFSLHNLTAWSNLWTRNTDQGQENLMMMTCNIADLICLILVSVIEKVY